jgi:hypothetical protein
MRTDLNEKGVEMATKKRPVIVCTESRGVFFGFTTDPKGADPMILRDAQMCIYWSRDVKGVLGLGATGPSRECRITKPVPKLEVRRVTAVIDVTPEAVNAWQAVPWS